MIDAQRNLNTTYRVNRERGGALVRTYPPADKPVSQGWYRIDQLPQWLVEAMALLDAAHPEGIPDLGHRVGDATYWVEPPTRGTAGERIAAMVPAWDKLAAMVNDRRAYRDKADDETNERLKPWYAEYGHRYGVRAPV